MSTLVQTLDLQTPDLEALPIQTLYIQTLGHGSVQRDGQEVHFPSQSARDLLFYLLSYPEGRSKEDILETLWQLSPDPASFNRFRVTVHRLRAALGGPEALLEHYGRYHLSSSVLASSDVYTFYGGLERGLSGKNAAERWAGLDVAVGVYGGDYLPGLTADWALEAREEHRAGYIRARLERAGMHCDALDCDAAISDLTLAAETDPYLGEHHQQELLACLSTVRGKAAATEHYHRFARVLKNELNDTPLEETQALILGIRAGAPTQGHQIGVDTPCPRRRNDGVTPPLELQSGDLTALHAELERRELLLQLTEGLLGLRDPADIVRLAFAHLGRQLEAKSVLLFELESGHLRPHHTWGEGIHHLEQQPDLVRLLSSGTPFFEALIHRGEAYYTGVLDPLEGIGWGEGVGELALEPVRGAGGATWVLAVVRPPSEHGWTPEEKALLHRVARSVVASAGRELSAQA